jgi:D-alanyl-D-alanine carboxypeptidase
MWATLNGIPTGHVSIARGRLVRGCSGSNEIITMNPGVLKMSICRSRLLRHFKLSILILDMTFPLVAPGQSLSKPEVDVVNGLPQKIAKQIDATAEQVLRQTGVPSASIAIIKGGAIVYTHAYGRGRLKPLVPASPRMRYSVGSISKEFTAAALLLLQEEGKLSIDDPVSKYFPDLTRAKEITIRMLLSHTSGYQDYSPEDYLMPPMKRPTTSNRILEVWGRKPLDFEPGTKWQYSNTNYVIAGRIAEIESGMPLFDFLDAKIFKPLHMGAVWDSDNSQLGGADAQGYIRYALGPLRPAPQEGQGWTFAAGELAMPAYDLATWDISLLRRSLLDAHSYEEMFAPMKLDSGVDTHYALGLMTGIRNGQAFLEHDGEVSGFTADNVVFPSSKTAIVVLTNQDASSAARTIARTLEPIVLNETPPANEAELQALRIFTDLQRGRPDRKFFTEWCNSYFDTQAIRDYSMSLGPLGKPSNIRQVRESLRGGMMLRVFHLDFPDGNNKLEITTFTEPDGKFEQFIVSPI